MCLFCVGRPSLFPFSCVRLAPLCVCCALSPSVALNFFRASPLAQSTRHSSDSEMMSITFAAFVSSSALHVPASALASMRLTGLPVHQMHHALPLMRSSHLKMEADGKAADDGELDAEDTTDSWESQLAEQAAWMAAQNKQQGKADVAAAEVWDGEVDETAWFDEEDDEDDQTRIERQEAEKQLALLLGRIEKAGGKSPVASTAPPDNAKVMLSLKSVLSGMMRLEEKIDDLNEKVDKLLKAKGSESENKMAPGAFGSSSSSSSSPSAASPSPPPAASAKKDYLPSDWDGNTIEDAYFDEEDTDEELADWRDVRKAKAMLEAMAKAEEDGKSEEDGEGETSEDK